MAQNDESNAQAAPSHFVEYDPLAPSPVFSKQQIDYVERISAFLSPDEVERVRTIEWLN